MTTLGATGSAMNVDPWARQADLTTALGFIATSFPPFTATSVAALASQRNYASGLYLYAGETITNVCCCVTTAGAGTAPTSIKLGLWSSASPAVCLALTSNLAADARWTSLGWKVNALTAPYSVTTSGLYYASLWTDGAFGTTPLQLAVGATDGAFGGPLGAGPYKNWQKSSIATLTVADTATYATGGNQPWLGVS